MIDFHVHLFSSDDLPPNSVDLPYQMPEPNLVKDYLDKLIKAGIKPKLINNVHLSVLPNSDNVFKAFIELDRLKLTDPARYGDITMIGTIVACPVYATADRLMHPQIKGIRVVLHDAHPNSILSDSYCSNAWGELYSRLRSDQHIHIYAQDPEVNLKVLHQIPSSIPVIIDHLGTCLIGNGVNDKHYQSLLKEAKSRNNVWFKGPGYRTAKTPEAVLPFTLEIIKQVGANRLILESTDAPHVGADSTGISYAELFDLESALKFTHRLAELTAKKTDLDELSLLSGACSSVLDPSKCVIK